jgi:NAD(P)-dependent dehydrogenase (short-subunit alcohol dehydrogenase family)
MIMPNDPALQLAGLTAVITGSSSGIGRAIALELAAAGAQVVVHARASRQQAEEVAALVTQSAGQSHVILSDLADPAGHAPFVESAWQWHDSIDIWVNNAGADVLTGEAATWSFQRKLQTLWQVDVAATIGLSRAVGSRMKARGSGTIINMGWDQAASGMAGDSGQMFAAVKGAVMAFTGSLARSLAPEVRVNCVAPGWIKTKWAAGASRHWHDLAVGQSLVGRWGTPEDVAAAVRFLASPAAAFINGQTIPVNGGFRSS